MRDIIDRANELTEKEREAILAKHRHKITAFSLTHCQDCDEPIPEARQNVIGCSRCIDCQTIYEQKQKHYRSY